VEFQRISLSEIVRKGISCRGRISRKTSRDMKVRGMFREQEGPLEENYECVLPTSLFYGLVYHGPLVRVILQSSI
jgi:hypothetical protein